jgi:16S rRNA G527 N7-methylase RsmG
MFKKNLEKYLKKYEKNFKDFETLLKLYNFWNEKINISSIKNEKEIIIKHFLDSLF